MNMLSRLQIRGGKNTLSHSITKICINWNTAVQRQLTKITALSHSNFMVFSLENLGVILTNTS